ncbi:MFS transporter [Microbacterium sp. F2]|uniref:MFS transporter n=1 Tax=Microbacterium sp. F2 TaxID=3422228 RepID=UPI003FD19691
MSDSEPELREAQAPTPDATGVPTPPPTTDTDALESLAVLFQDSTEERHVPRKQVISWAFWDWATQPFNSVILTFVFAALYLVSDSFLPADVASLPDDSPVKEAALADLTSGYGLVTTIAGLLILFLAPVLGQQADRRGSKKRWLFVFTMLLALTQFALFFVYAQPGFFWYGAAVLAVGAVISEIAGVNYNALLVQVSTPKTVGKVSGLGWGMGYIGGIVALVIVVALTFADWFGMDTSDGLAYRLIAVGCGVWTILFSIPLFRNVPEPPPSAPGQSVGFFRSYVVLVHDIARLFREHRPTFWFLIASAVYRDGLAGVFAFGGVLAAVAFGFGPTDVILFAIAANVVAGLSTVIAGRFDDRFGAKAVIVFALTTLVLVAFVVFAFHDLGAVIFWIGGLILSAMVGPAQAASRSLLARVTPTGMQGEIFGLYATTGRVASFLSPAMWTVFIAAFGSTIFGVLGIGLVLLLGLILLLFVRLPKRSAA